MITESERSYLLECMKNLLSKYNYTYTENALNKIIDAWADKKYDLIEAFKRHPNYLPGKFMIVLDCNFNREIDASVACKFSSFLHGSCMPTMMDTLPEDIKCNEFAPWVYCLPSDLHMFLGHNLDKYATHTLSGEIAEHINNMIPSIRAREGQRTSKVVNKICKYLGYDKHPEYNREFAKYADSISPLTITRRTILSLNPLDYLTMSFGNSWASCHTIDTKNIRDMPNSYSGAYSSGTISYMLDPSSMVFYTVDMEYTGDEYWSRDKINRQMFHWGENKLVQSRLYPQSNDGNGEVYAPYRNIVQKIMSEIFEFNNLWTLKKGYSWASRYINSYGTHYRDYENFSSCTLSIVKGSENENMIKVGANPICIECGYEHGINENINCCHNDRKYCERCGEEIDEEYDDYVEIDGYYYHYGCCHYCNSCEEYVVEDLTYVASTGEWVCDECLSERYTYCEECDRYVRNNDATYVESTDSYVCDLCLDRLYRQCDECNEYYLRSELEPDENGQYLCPNCS